jgi:acetyl esterase/lipase
MKKSAIIATTCLSLVSSPIAQAQTTAPTAPPTRQAPEVVVVTAERPAPVPVAGYAAYATIRGIQISPDGRHIIALVSDNGERVRVQVWRTDAMDQAPIVIDSPDRLTFVGARFVKNDKIAISTRQTFDFGETLTHIGGLQFSNLDGSAARPALPNVRRTGESADTRRFNTVNPPRIVSDLRNDPQHILVESNRAGEDGDIFKVNVYTGTATRVERGSEEFGGLEADFDGELRARQGSGIEDGRFYLAQWFRAKGSNRWEEHFRSYANERNLKTFVGYSDDPDVVFLSYTRPGDDKSSVSEYNIKTRQHGEVVFAHPLFDSTDLVISSKPGSAGEVRGGIYDGFEEGSIFWTDPATVALQQGIERALDARKQTITWIDPGTERSVRTSVPVGGAITMTSASDDGKSVVVVRSGPDTPPEYYLYREGQPLRLLGRQRANIDPASLGRSSVVQYRARDGLMIPAFLTLPPAGYGTGPHPTIILPHGGPWARDSFDWDSSGWTQYYASRGYAVLQPQFRGSRGWGDKLWRAGDREHGQKMQDDKDDGALWMIENGYARRGQIAMHGFSYGGYSSIVASVRPNGIYSCTIAGAGYASLNEWNSSFDSRFGREYQFPTIGGLSPIDRVNDVNIPVMVYHGNRDQIVPIRQSEQWVAALQQARKDVTWVRVVDMPHGFYVPGDWTSTLPVIETFLTDKCGMRPGQ